MQLWEIRTEFSRYVEAAAHTAAAAEIAWLRQARCGLASADAADEQHTRALVEAAAEAYLHAPIRDCDIDRETRWLRAMLWSNSDAPAREVATLSAELRDGEGLLPVLAHVAVVDRIWRTTRQLAHDAYRGGQ